MSQLAPVRSLPRTSSHRAATTPRQLKVVSLPEIQGNGAFLALCVLLLLAGFVGVLMLNTAMAKGSYTMRDLQARADELTDRQDALRHSIDEVSGPGPLAKRARALGMVPAETPAFLRLSDGKVLGVAKKAGRNTTFRVVTETQAPTAPGPSPAAPTPSPSPSPSASRSTPTGVATGATPTTPSTTPSTAPTTAGTGATPGPSPSTAATTPSPTPTR
jgi:hypothetical protein